MTQPLIMQANHISKSFIIYDQQSERIRAWLSRQKKGTEFWALKDISFDLHMGEVLGIIGPNGAGKSTLLKTLGGMYAPTKGDIKVNGKVHSIFELNSGLNSYLTGRQNIYQKCAVMGLTPPEVEARLSDIIDFTELDDFIDQPVKTYSVGMQARLAFAIATSTDADIFLIDEILAVGDEYFQGQCRRRIHELVGKGKAAIIATHDLPSYLRLCTRGMMLEKGEVIAMGNPLKTLERYVSTLDHYTVPRPEGLEITWLEIDRQASELNILVHYYASKDIRSLDVVITIEKIDPEIGWETCILEPSFNSGFEIRDLHAGESGVFMMKCSPLLLSGKGFYYVSAALRPATGSLIHTEMFYDAVGWTLNNYDTFFEIRDGGSALMSYPLKWIHHPENAYLDTQEI